MTETFVESMLREALESVTTRRLAQRVMGDVERMRRGAPLPEDHDALRDVVRGEFADACYLRLGKNGGRALSALDDRAVAIAVLPRELWASSRDRLVFVGREAASAASMASALGASDWVHVDDLVGLLLAIDDEVRTCVVVDARDCPIAHDLLAGIAPDFPGNVSVVVASMDDDFRSAFLRTGAAFRSTLRPEPPDDPKVVEHALAALRGMSPEATRRRVAGSTTTTQPLAA